MEGSQGKPDNGWAIAAIVHDEETRYQLRIRSKAMGAMRTEGSQGKPDNSWAIVTVVYDEDS
jgi:hypothetical protein